MVNLGSLCLEIDVMRLVCDVDVELFTLVMLLLISNFKGIALGKY
jgi:hypothetical protein